jgi:site-specific recombinase XerD
MFGDKILSLYTLAEVEDFKNSFLNRGCSKVTANLHFRGCKTIFNFGVKHGLLEKNVFGKSRQFRLEQSRPTFVSTEDFQKLLSVVTEQRMKDIFVFATLTGMRLNEITNFQWSNIDLGKNQIIISNSESFTTKSGRIRTIPMHSEVVAMMQRLLTQRKQGQEYVFSKPNGYKFLGGYISHQFKRYVRLAKLDDNLHFHSLRHTCASHLVSAGVSLYVVQNILGHANVATTMIYSHLSPNSLQESINKIEL